MAISKITSKYQTTVPREVRERLGVGPSDHLRWDVQGNKVVLSAEESPTERVAGRIHVAPGRIVADVKQARRMRGAVKW